MLDYPKTVLFNMCIVSDRFSPHSDGSTYGCYNHNVRDVWDTLHQYSVVALCAT